MLFLVRSKGDVMKKRTKKLNLSRETLIHLEENGAPRAIGGADSLFCTRLPCLDTRDLSCRCSPDCTCSC